MLKLWEERDTPWDGYRVLVAKALNLRAIFYDDCWDIEDLSMGGGSIHICLLGDWIEALKELQGTEGVE